MAMNYNDTKKLISVVEKICKDFNITDEDSIQNIYLKMIEGSTEEDIRKLIIAKREAARIKKQNEEATKKVKEANKNPVTDSEIQPIIDALKKLGIDIKVYNLNDYKKNKAVNKEDDSGRRDKIIKAMQGCLNPDDFNYIMQYFNFEEREDKKGEYYSEDGSLLRLFDYIFPMFFN